MCKNIRNEFKCKVRFPAFVLSPVCAYIGRPDAPIGAFPYDMKLINMCIFMLCSFVVCLLNTDLNFLFLSNIQVLLLSLCIFIIPRTRA